MTTSNININNAIFGEELVIVDYNNNCKCKNLKYWYL